MPYRLAGFYPTKVMDEDAVVATTPDMRTIVLLPPCGPGPA